MATKIARFTSVSDVSNERVDRIKNLLFDWSNTTNVVVPVNRYGTNDAAVHAEELLAQISNAHVKLIGLLNEAIVLNDDVNHFLDLMK